MSGFIKNCDRMMDEVRFVSMIDWIEEDDVENSNEFCEIPAQFIKMFSFCKILDDERHSPMESSWDKSHWI